MDRFAYAYKGIQHSLFVLLLLSTSTQAEVLFAPAVFTAAAAHTASQAEGARSGQKKATLQRTAQGHPQPVNSPRNRWIRQPLKAHGSTSPLPPKLRF